MVQPHHLLDNAPFRFGRLTLSAIVAEAMSQKLGRGVGFSSYVSLVERWLSRYTPTTQAAYGQAVRHWCQWVGERRGDLELGVALLELDSRSSEEALKTVLRWYRTALANEDRSPAKIRQHLAALRSFRAYIEADTSRRMNADAEQRAEAWLAANKWKKLVAHKSTEQPAILPDRMVSRLLALTSDARDQAILALMLYHRLTPIAVSQLDLDDTADWQLDSSDELEASESEASPAWQRRLEQRLVKNVRQVDYAAQAGWPVVNRFPLRRAIRQPLEGWLEERGRAPGPLFVNRDRAGKGNRLTTRSINRIVHDAGARIDRPDLSPRLLRRAGQPGRRRTARLVEGIAARRQQQRAARLADFDRTVQWDTISLPETDLPPWAWRDKDLQLEFASEIRDRATWQVERGFRSVESWHELMTLLAANVDAFEVPVHAPAEPPAKPLPKRRRRALYAR